MMELDSVGIVLDEISLEGLEGITLESLWIRLSDVQFHLNPLEKHVQQFIWSNIIFDKAASQDLQFYKIPAARKTIVLYDRYQHMNPDTGACLETNEVPEDVYGLVTPVCDGNIRGSCNCYDKRKDVTKQILDNNHDLDTVESIYGNTLVIVASQTLRESSLRLTCTDPCISLTPIQYCVLERIGRSRRYGEVTVGKEAPQYKEQPKTLFYYRKILRRRGLIKKQQHNLSLGSGGQNRVGLVLMLPRFYRTRYIPLEKAALRIGQHLLSMPDRECDYYSLQDAIKIKKKLFKLVFPSFPKYFQVYECPDLASKKDPKRLVKLLREVDFEAESDDEADDDDNGDGENESTLQLSNRHVKNFASVCTIFDPSVILADRSLATQILSFIDTYPSDEGVTLRSIGEKLRLPKLVVRLIVRILERSGEIATHMADKGRQKITKCQPIHKVDRAPPEDKNEEEEVLKFSANETATFMKRANIIFEAVKKHKILDEIITFKKLITEAEKDSPYVIDRKSIRRIIHKLACNGYVRYIKTVLTWQGNHQLFEIICDPSITANSRLVRDRIETKKFRLFGKFGDESTPSKIIPRESACSKENDNKKYDCELKYKPSVARRYGLEPKMRKLMTLYKYLFHLIYVSDKRKYRDWRQNIPNISLASDGSCTLGDIIPRMPLSIYVRIVFLNYEIPDLETYLTDPGRRNLTMQMLPPSLRRHLMLRRKYIFNIFEELVSLSIMNLLKIDYQDQCPKETTKIFLMNQFKFMDFGSLKEYTLRSEEDIDNMINDLTFHCSRKDCNNCTLDPRLFAHNHRNWTYAPTFKGPIGSDTNSDIANSLCRPRKRIRANLQSNQESANVLPAASKTIGAALKTSNPLTSREKRVLGQKAEGLQAKRIKTNGKSTNPKPKRWSSANDEADIFALRNKTKSRVQWSKEEDSFLLMCRVASILLDPTCPTFVCVPGSLVRNELHKHLPETASDKTIKACQRRLNYMLKSATTRKNVLEWVSDVKTEIDSLNIGKPDKPKSDVETWSDYFLKYLHVLLTKFQAYHLSLTSTSLVPAKQYDSLEDLEKDHKILETETIILPFKPVLFQEPNNIVDICVNVVLNVIVSTLLRNCIECSTGEEDSTSLSLTLFKIYQKYPDTLIRSVVTKLTRNRIMTKKRFTKEKVFTKHKGLAPYKIANWYLFRLKTVYNILDLPISVDKGEQMIKNSGERSQAALILSSFASKPINFNIELPDSFFYVNKDILDSSDNSTVRGQAEGSRDPKFISRFNLQCYREQLNSRPSGNNLSDSLVLKSFPVTCQVEIDEFDYVEINAILTDEGTYKPDIRPEVDNSALKQLASFIRTFKDLGATEKDLSKNTTDDLKRLLNSQLVFKVGVNQYRYVHYDYVDHWLVPSQSPRNVTPQRELKFVPKFWKDAFGKVRKKLLFTFFCKIVATLWLNPGINLVKLSKIMSEVLPPVQTMDLLDFMQRLNCVKYEKIISSTGFILFNDIADATSNSDNHSLYFHATSDSFIILSQLKKFMTS